jgi:hypothetical protein
MCNDIARRETGREGRLSPFRWARPPLPVTNAFVGQLAEKSDQEQNALDDPVVVYSRVGNC